MLKKLSIVFATVALLATSSAVASQKYGWSPEKGKKLYISKIKKKMCNKLHVKKFTQAHTQKEWKEIIDNGTLFVELKKLCPNFDESAFTEKQIANLGDALINYAKDSYNIPS